MEFSTLGLSKAEMDFNFLVGCRATSACYTSTTSTQQLHHSINRTPPLAVQLNGCACEGLCSLKSPPLLDFYLSNHPEDEIYFNVGHFRSGCYFNDGNAGGYYFNNDNFEDCYFTDGHEEDGYLNDGQGVNETLEAFKTLLLCITGNQGQATPTLGPGQKLAPMHPKGPM